MKEGRAQPEARRTRVITGRHASGSAVAGILLLALLIGIAWRATNVVWFLLFPLLLIGMLVAAAVGVLWGIRHF